MLISSIGVNHTTASIDLREKLTFTEEQIRTILSRYNCGHQNNQISEICIISTCNRIELIAVSDKPVFIELENLLSEVGGGSIIDLEKSIYRYSDLDAAAHLFDVAAGLDSLVLGEPQILGQITRSLELARGLGTAGPIINRLFHIAIHAGKRVRTETAISRNSASVSSLAASVAQKTIPDIKEARVLVLGAGEMAELTIESLINRGVEKVCVINRTLDHAKAVASKWGAEFGTFESLNHWLSISDIVISSTGAPHLIISREMIKNIKRDKPLLLIDIALPRDIDPDCCTLPNITLFDLDTLNTRLEQSLAERQSQVPLARKIINEELESFKNYLKSIDMLPLIADMHHNAEQLRIVELEKTFRHLPDLTDVEKNRIEGLTQALVRKILDTPIRRLRTEAESPNASEFAHVARSLFGLRNQDGPSVYSTNPYNDSITQE